GGARTVSFGDLRDRPAAVSPKREEGNEGDALRRAVVDDVVARALGQVVAVLNGDDRDDLARALDLVDADLGEPDVPDLSALPVLLDRGQALFERRLRVDSMQVVERDRFRTQTPKAFLDLRAEYLRAPFAGVEATLRCHHAAPRDRRQRRTDRL